MAGIKVGPLTKKVQGSESRVVSYIFIVICFERSLGKNCIDLDLCCGLITSFVSPAYFPVGGIRLNRSIHLS